MTGSIEWIWYGVGAVLGAVAIALGAWALLWDRSRGRLRCPRCWYSMDGIAANPGKGGAEMWTCPECGRTIRRERALRKTRRRWRMAGIAAVLLYAAAQSALVPMPGRDGRWRFVPTCVLALVADLDDPADPATDRLVGRLWDGGFAFPWDRALVRQLELRGVPASWDEAVQVRRQWWTECPVRVRLRWCGEWMTSIAEDRSIVMMPDGERDSSAALDFFQRHPSGVEVFYGDPRSAPEYLDLPAPKIGENEYTVDLELRSGRRVLARRTLRLRVEGVTEIGQILRPVDPSPGQRLAPILEFGVSDRPPPPFIWVQYGRSGWQRADFARCFRARLWDGDTLLGESSLDDLFGGPEFPLDLESAPIIARLRDDGHYLDISGLDLEIVPDEVAALRDVRRSTDYSNEHARVPLLSLPFQGVAPDAVLLRTSTIPLTPRPSPEWMSQNGFVDGDE